MLPSEESAMPVVQTDRIEKQVLLRAPRGATAERVATPG